MPEGHSPPPTTGMPDRYRGRLAPTPTGELHLGHARTFHAAWRRAREAGGQVVLRIEDLDPLRCRPEFTRQLLDDLRWMELDWDEGPYLQSARRAVYVDAWQRLRDTGHIYPSHVTRKDVRDAAHAPHDDEEGSEPVFPPALREPVEAARDHATPDGVVWRFRVPDGETIAFDDARFGHQAFVAGTDFGDFVLWRKDGVPAYELAVVADDIAMGISEVVRGADLLRSTARQLLLYRALGAAPPQWCHEALVRGPDGRRLAKRHQSLSLRTLREQGVSWPEALARVASADPVIRDA